MRMSMCITAMLPQCRTVMVRFPPVVSFTVLHHVPSFILQNHVFAEAHRVLRPGGIFAGVDSLSSILMRIIHLGDTMTLVDPATLDGRLKTAGFRSIRIALGAGRIRFSAKRPYSTN